ncbi:hypothetical protein N7988_28075 (plasmid) [Bacillus cereus]|uniref:hypothetical protein n=1 Tax=Bacillus cereus TaxID=1396 RepID=UPI0021CB3D92|nr:hypothetical protein [Bacillus cereus]MCU7756888.1 hypothetical protein [Bacillus cereus]MDC7752528.1 hypothetical protein [Bacillus cereus]UXP17370.1 hypothetical protein N7988_28075 [Bacillus cereus]
MDRGRVEVDFQKFIGLLDIKDFDMLLVVAIGSRHLIQSEIKEIYNKDQEYYFELFKNSCYYKDNRIKALSALNYKAIQQFIGIYLHGKQHESNDTILKLIKKGYKFVFNFVKNRNEVDFYELRDAHLKYVSKNSFSKTVHSANIFTIALYLCNQLSKKIIYEEFDINLINQSLSQISSELKVDISENMDDGEFLNQYKQLGILKRGFTLPLNNLIIAMNNIHKQQYAEKNNLNFNLHAEKINKEISNHAFYSGISRITYMLTYCNIDPIDLQNVTTITDDKFKEIFGICLMYLGRDYTQEELYSLLASYLIIYSLAQDYDTTKHNYIVSSSDEMFYELKKLKNDYENKINTMQHNEEKKQREIDQLVKINKRMEISLIELEQNIKKKENEIQELRDTIYKLEEQKDKLIQEKISYESQDLRNQEPSVEKIASYINNRKCIIVGGDKNWQGNIRDYLTKCHFISPDELNIDLEYLKNYDLIIFNETYNNHSMYNKIKVNANSYKIPIVYSGSYTNIRRLLAHIYKQINVNLIDELN